MQPTITRSLRRATEISCMLICSGTSRLVVIGGESLPPVGEQRNQLLLDLMLGKPHGLGGEGSQANKVAVVTSDREREAEPLSIAPGRVYRVGGSLGSYPPLRPDARKHRL